MPYQQKLPTQFLETSAAPAWALVNDEVFIAWKGPGSDTGIYSLATTSATPDSKTGQYDLTNPQSPFNALNQSWVTSGAPCAPSGPTPAVPQVLTSASPAMAIFGGLPYLAWKGASDNTIWFIAYDFNDSSWGTQQQVVVKGAADPPKTDRAPALASAGNTLCMAWKGESIGDIWWAKCDGQTWVDPQLAIGGTSESPALASDGSFLYMAWKGESDNTLWWSKFDGSKWGPQQRTAGGSTDSAPAIAVDANHVVWLAWKDAGSSDVYYKYSTDLATNQWSAPTNRPGIGTSGSPALLSTGGSSSGLILAWKGEGTDHGIYYGPLRLPAQQFTFDVPLCHISMMRTGHAGLKDGSDTDYASLAVKVMGQPAVIKTLALGDQTGGDVNIGLGIPSVTVQDGDTVMLHYHIVNSGAGQTSAFSYLENVANKLLSGVESANGTSLQSTGQGLVSLAANEAGLLIGSALGIGAGIVVPIFGVVIGALADWLTNTLWGFAFPDCDGPVANGLYVFSFAELLKLTQSQNVQNGTYIQSDDNPGITSAGGCGQNSDYQVTWNCVWDTPQTLLGP
jgi:hypothetical protein